jgi:hypothetical protein
MGAIAIKHWLSVPENSILPNEFRVSAFPNPFNDVVKINILSPLRGNAEISIFDIQGREIMSRNINLELGKNSIELNGSTLNSSGVYLLNVNIEEQSSIIKLVYMP